MKTASQPWVTNNVAQAVAPVTAGVATNAARIATLSQSIDYSTNNTALVDTIETVAPQPGDYATVSNLAVHAVQTETDPVWNAEKSGYATTDALAGKQDALTAQQLANIAAVPAKLDKSGGIMTPAFTAPTILSGQVVFGADAGGPYIGMTDEKNTAFLRPHNVTFNNRNAALAAANPTAGNLAALDADGNPTDSLIPATNVATKTMIPTAQINAATTTNALQDAELESHASQLSQLSQSLDGKATTSDIAAATNALSRVAHTGAYSDLAGTPTTWPYTAITNAPWLTSYTETDPTVPAWAKDASKPSYSYSEISNTPDLGGYATTDALDNYLPLSGGVVTGNVFVAQQPGDTNAILAAVGEQTYGRYSVPASGSYPGLSIDYKDERTIAALLKEDDMPLVRLERIKHGRYSTYSSYTNQLRTIEYEKAELDMDGLGHVRIDKDGNSVACDIRWPEPPEGTNYVCGTMAFREEIPEVPTEWDYSAITNAPWLTSYTEADPTVPGWAKASSKPSYSYSEIAGTPTTWPYTAITNAPWLTSYTETDPTVPGWAKASSKPSYSYSEISNTPDLGGYATTAALDAGTNTVAGLGARIFYGTCSTGASTAAKVVTCAGFKTADLKAGTVLWVKFTNAQTYNGAPTINVNSTGAVNVKRVGTTNAARYEWVAGELICFVHDGSYWVMTDGGLATTSYYGATKLTTTATSTGTTLALTPASLNSFSLGMIAPYPVYAKTGIYEPGDRVRYSYNTYICKASVVSQDWNAASWEMMDPIQTQLDDLRPSGPVATNSVVRATSGDACRVSLASGATLSAALDVEGVPVMGLIEPAGAYSVSSSIHLLGYGAWPTNTFQAVFWRVGQTTFANVLSEL